MLMHVTASLVLTQANRFKLNFTILVLNFLELNTRRSYLLYLCLVSNNTVVLSVKSLTQILCLVVSHATNDCI